MKETALIGIDRRGRKVTSFATAVEAAEKLGVSRQAVGQAVKREGVCAGLYWKRVPRLFVVKVGKALEVCTRQGGDYVKVGTGDRYRSPDRAAVTEVTEAMWTASMARDL